MQAITSTDPIELMARLLNNSRVGAKAHPFTNLTETENAVGHGPEGPIKEDLLGEAKRWCGCPRSWNGRMSLTCRPVGRIAYAT